MPKFRKWALRITKTLAVLLALMFLAALIWFRHALYHHFVRFPREEAAWQALRAERQALPQQGPWKEYRGILHSHSVQSHDCEVPFEQILEALKQAKIDFICLSDHCTDGRADFSAQWRGLHDGKLFIPGFEMRDGVMPFGVKEGVVLSNTTPVEVLAKQVAENAGVLFFAHPEEPRQWNVPELTGMEIYNTHSDFKRYRPGFSSLLPEFLLNQERYPDHVFRLLFQKPDSFLQHWDELNKTRHITGIAGNDCHQNTGLRIICSNRNELSIEETSPKGRRHWKLNWLTRPLVRLCLGPLSPGKMMFHVQLDPYERMARFVNTHVLAQELSEASVLDALRAGRVFVGFDMLVDSSGFSWKARDKQETAWPGEALLFSEQVEFEALSPVPCRFIVVQNGSKVLEAEGRSLRWRPNGPGKYRVQAELKILKEWTPWVYVSPIELR